VYTVAERSDYKDFIRLYVISDYFRGLNQKERLAEIFYALESFGAEKAVLKLSLCIAMTKREYKREFGGSLWIKTIPVLTGAMKHRRKASGLRKVSSRN